MKKLEDTYFTKEDCAKYLKDYSFVGTPSLLNEEQETKWAMEQLLEAVAKQILAANKRGI